jgi:hypothetical protein
LFNQKNKMNTTQEQLKVLREGRDQIEASIRALEDQAVAEALARDEKAPEVDCELPVVGYMTLYKNGAEVPCKEYPEFPGWPGNPPVQTQPLVRLSDAQRVINELSDLVTSLSETQAPIVGSDEFFQMVAEAPIVKGDRPIPIPAGPNDALQKVVEAIVTKFNEARGYNESFKHDIVLVPSELSPETAELMIGFVTAMLLKLLKSERKYGYSTNWMRTGWMEECRSELRKHVLKGDPLDVAAYCAFLWFHGASTKYQD